MGGMAEHRTTETEGQKAFDAFLRDHKLTLAAAAEVLGVSEPAVHGWRTGEKRPVDFQRAKIEAWTGIKAPTWRTPEEAEDIGAVQPFTSAVAC